MFLSIIYGSISENILVPLDDKPSTVDSVYKDQLLLVKRKSNLCLYDCNKTWAYNFYKMSLSYINHGLKYTIFRINRNIDKL